jgi:hypothetical protein
MPALSRCVVAGIDVVQRYPDPEFGALDEMQEHLAELAAVTA